MSFRADLSNSIPVTPVEDWRRSSRNLQGRSPLGGLCGSCIPLLLSRLLSLGLPLSFELFGGLPLPLGVLDSLLRLFPLLPLSLFLLCV